MGWVRSLFSRNSHESPAELSILVRGFRRRDGNGRLGARVEGRSVADGIAVNQTIPRSILDADSVWDAPVIAERSSNAPPALDESDFSEVWKKRVSPLENIDWKSLERASEKPGFFSRLFSRKKKEEPVFVRSQSFDDITALHPVTADFADDPAVSAAPAAEDFASPADDPDDTVPHPMPAVPPPSFASRQSEESGRESPGFPAFRDARDDFADEDSKGRASQDLDDEGEKTDEFEAVPPPTGVLGATAETRQVAGFFGRVFGRKDSDAVAKAAAMPTMGLADDKTPFVLAKFRTFYNEVIRDKHQKSDVIAGFSTAVMGVGGTTEESDPEFAAQLLSKRLSEMLELQAAESNWTGGDAAKYYPDAQYAMVALADETFATIDWPGRPSWHKYMLEPRMYGSRGADIEFFKRIDKLLKEAPNEKGARDLARLYLVVIASGFRGKFRIPNVRRPLAEYRRRLYEYSHQMDPLELYARDRRIFPQAAANTLVSRSVGRFTPAQKWIAVALVLAALYIGVSHYMWRSVSADLRDVMSRVQSSISQPAAR